MDVKTGGVLGMVSYPTYDLNNAFTVQNDLFKKNLTDTSDQLLKQWRNKTLNDTYEPGSTFKILTMSAAMEEGLINMNTTYTCTGGIHVSDATIHCTGTHGTQTLKEAAAHSCNPAFITFGLQLGNEKFYEYMNDFGLMQGSGVDLDGEASGVFASPESFTQLDLACYAFGQNFNVTPMALIAAQAACVNGGYLHAPYLVEQIVDSDGNVTYQHDNTPVRQVISEETSAHVRECLEYVVSDGTGRNGQVKGYRVGGKTGTADKGQTGDLVVSFVSFAPADDPQVIILVTMDTPSRSAGTSVSGGSMVAPVNSKIMADILPYLGIEPTYSAEELLGADTTVPYVIGSTVEDARSRMEARGFTCKVVGSGRHRHGPDPCRRRGDPRQGHDHSLCRGRKAQHHVHRSPAGGQNGGGGQRGRHQRRAPGAVQRRHADHLRQYPGAEPEPGGRTAGACRHGDHRPAGRYQYVRLRERSPLCGSAGPAGRRSHPGRIAGPAPGRHRRRL